eukprot:scaffold264154_cov65-Attheya_sp.AAC.1
MEGGFRISGGEGTVPATFGETVGPATFEVQSQAMEPFGGITIMLAGDSGQLPPVRGNAVWNKKASNKGHDTDG